VTFDHEIRDGAATASYGVDVARMAGVPDPVVERARDLLDGAPEDRTNGHAGPATAANGDGHGGAGAVDSHRGGATADGGRAGEVPPELLETLDGVDLGSTTPLEALNTLAELKRLAGDG
jgi:DNA mismatch repair protein MutS